MRLYAVGADFVERLLRLFVCRGERGIVYPPAKGGKTEYLLPVTDETEGALKVLAEYCRRNGEDLNLVAVPEKYKERVERILNRPLTDMDESDCDYVYAASDLVNLVGRKYNGQRNHLNRFKRDYPSAVFRRLKPEDKDALMEFLAEYHVNDTSDTYLYDRKAVRTFIENFDKFSFLCGAVFLDKKSLLFRRRRYRRYVIRSYRKMSACLFRYRRND